MADAECIQSCPDGFRYEGADVIVRFSEDPSELLLIRRDVPRRTIKLL